MFIKEGAKEENIELKRKRTVGQEWIPEGLQAQQDLI